jgi:hypothetical protein
MLGCILSDGFHYALHRGMLPVHRQQRGELLSPFVASFHKERRYDSGLGATTGPPFAKIRPVSTVGNVEINAAVDCIAGVVASCADQCLPGTHTGRFQLVGETREATLQQILDELSAQD